MKLIIFTNQQKPDEQVAAEKKAKRQLNADGAHTLLFGHFLSLAGKEDRWKKKKPEHVVFYGCPQNQIDETTKYLGKKYSGTKITFHNSLDSAVVAITGAPPVVEKTDSLSDVLEEEAAMA